MNIEIIQDEEYVYITENSEDSFLEDEFQEGGSGSIDLSVESRNYLSPKRQVSC